MGFEPALDRPPEAGDGGSRPGMKAARDLRSCVERPSGGGEPVRVSRRSRIEAAGIARRRRRPQARERENAVAPLGAIAVREGEADAGGGCERRVRPVDGDDCDRLCRLAQRRLHHAAFDPGDDAGLRYADARPLERGVRSCAARGGAERERDQERERSHAIRPAPCDERERRNDERCAESEREGEPRACEQAAPHHDCRADRRPPAHGATDAEEACQPRRTAGRCVGGAKRS